MREILFRGKRVDNGEWVEGSFCMDATEQLSGYNGTDGFIRRFNPETCKMDMFEVDRETVGQFTGLTDRNDVKIFEGDIVVAKAYYSPPANYKIRYYAGCGKFELFRPNLNRVFGWQAEGCGLNLDDLVIKACMVEVIGNIYDDPKLLER